MFFSIELLYSPIPPIAKDLYTIHSFYAILRPVFGLIHVLFDVIAAPREVGVNLKQGYNGELTSKQAGSVGGQMVKKMIESYENGLK